LAGWSATGEAKLTLVLVAAAGFLLTLTIVWRSRREQSAASYFSMTLVLFRRLGLLFWIGPVKTAAFQRHQMSAY
jgi:hypothetical protein